MRTLQLDLRITLLQVCEYVMKVTNGDVKSDVVPVATRLQFLQTWVRTKQLLQSQISKALGTENEVKITKIGVDF